MDFVQYLDYRKDIVLSSKTFYILYKDYGVDKNKHDLNFKTLIVGPIQSNKNIKTTKAFYNEFDESLNRAQSGIKNNYDFVVDIKMEAGGEKVIDVSMNGLKLFLKIDVLYVI